MDDQGTREWYADLRGLPEYGISSASFYKYKSKYGGMDISDAKKLKALEDENNRLKKLLAEQMLDIAMLEDVNSNKW